MDNVDVGRRGEELAVEFLRKKGYRVIERNFTFGKGEVDIIALDGKTVVFIEVKSRRSGQFGSPEDAVGQRKQRQLAKLALAYLQRHRLYLKVDCRFDVVAVSFDDRTIKHITNAFQSPL
jgi:putative endonuclease